MELEIKFRSSTMIAEVCFVLGRHGEKKGWSGKLDPYNKTVEHEQMNVWFCNAACV